MANKQLNTRIVLRNDTAVRWSSENPVLRKGEIGIVFDPSVEDANYVVDFKVGDGVKTWNQLPLFRGNIGDIVGRVEALETTVATHTTQINNLETRVTAAESDIDDLQSTVATHTSQINGIVNDVSALSGRVTNAESAISALQSAASNYATHGEVNGLATRVTAAESDIQGLATRMTAAESDIDNLQFVADTHSEKIGDLATDLNTAEESIATINGQISGLSHDVSEISVTVGSLVSGLATANSLISANAAAIATHSTQIAALDARVDTLEGNHFIIAQPTGEDRHPDVQDPVANAIYLVPKAEGSGYCEWLYLQVSEEPATYRWEEIGDTDIDLSDYATKAFVTGAIAGAISDLNISQYATHGEVTAVSNALASEVSRATAAEAALDSRLDDIEADYLTQADSYILDCGNAQTNIN